MDDDIAGSLQRKVLSGGAFLAVRQGFSIVVGLVGLVYLTATIGPAAYGTYIAAARILDFVASLTEWSTGTFVLRAAMEEVEAVMDRAFTLMLGVGVLASVAVALLARPLGRWVGIESLDAVAMAVVAVLTLRLLYAIVVAGLEKRLRYAPVAFIEMMGQLTFYSVGILFALSGKGVWSVVYGLWSQQTLVLVSTLVVSRYRPRLRFDLSTVREILKFGSGMTTAQWITRFGIMAGPLLVGRLAGAEAVGTLALTVRMVEAAGFMKSAAWRISLAAFSRVRLQTERLRAAVSRGVELETGAVGLALVFASLIAPLLLPLVLSDKWDPALEVFPLVALAYLLNSLFSLRASALFILGRTWSVALINLSSVFVLIVSAWFLIPPYGLTGFGVALVLAEAANLLTLPVLAKEVGRGRLGLSVATCALLGLALFWTKLGLWAMIPALLMFAHPAVRSSYVELYRGLRDRHRQPDEEEEADGGEAGAEADGEAIGRATEGRS